MDNKYSLNMGWKFVKKDVPEAYQVDYDDQEWEDISLPHTFNDIDTFDNFMEGGHNGERSMYTGKSWYRKRFKLDSKLTNKKVLVEFEGVRQAAQVYLNGVKLEGKSENGFIPFGYDLTPFCYFGDQDNILTVMVDNSFPYYAEGTNDILSWHDSHWHPTHGGIYRNVNLYVKDKLHITLPLYSFLKTEGIYAYSKNLTRNATEVGIEVEIQNDYLVDKSFIVEAKIIDQENHLVSNTKQSVTIHANDKNILIMESKIDNPKRWSPDYPYNYTIQVKVFSDGEVLDKSEVPLGIKEVEFTNNQGFFINGHPLKLKGWGQRPTNEWAGLGVAFPDWMHSYIQDLMKEAGANFIRWGHSAGAPADIRASDQLGLLTIQPGVDGEGSTIGGVYSEVSYKIRIAAFRDMVIYFRNNPSIFIWEGGNQSVPDREAQALLDITKKYDPYGGRAFAHRRSDLNMAKYVDVSIGTEGSWELKSKNKPIVEGEYNREEAARRVWDRYTPGYENYSTGAGSAYNLTSEDLAKNQAKHYKKISGVDHSGGANWIFSDSTSHGRVYSEVARVSGVVDAVMLPKEAFYAIKAIYRNNPQVYIIGHWNYPVGTVKDIYVMSNTDKVELFVNNRSLGFGKKSDDYLFTFENVEYQKGTIKAIAYDEDDNIIIQTIKKSAGKPTQIQLKALNSSLGLLANGADYLHIDIEVVDEHGIRVPTFEKQVRFEFEGPAIWRGGYNSGREGSTNHKYLDLEAGINRIALRTTTTPGTIKVIAHIDGLDSKSIEVTSLPVNSKNGLSKSNNIEKKSLIGVVPNVGYGPSKFSEFSVEKQSETIMTDFSYSGISDDNGIGTQVNTGNQIFADYEEEFKFMPDYLVGSEYLLLPNADRNYKALDLIHLSVAKDATIFIAHDDSLRRPLWLIENFEETEGKLFVTDKIHTIFKKDLVAESTITLGGNTDEEDVTNGNMYLVFAKKYDANLEVKAPIFQ